MKILLINKYFFIKGGAENSFFETGNLLLQKGHQVMYFSMQHERNLPSPYADYFVSNVDYEKPTVAHQLKAAGRLLYSWEAKRKLEALIQKEKPDLAHLNNIYHQLSPSILHTLKKYQIPVVMTLRDYKVVCASYSMMAGQQICEACRNGKYYHCFLKGCVKDSKVKSLLNTVEMYLHHNILDLYGLVDVFISPSLFLKHKVEAMGFKGKVAHVPNFTSLLKENPQYENLEKSAVYFGRLSKEKGLWTLLKAVKDLDVQLKIIGEGPIKEDLKRWSLENHANNIQFFGFLKGDALYDEIKRSLLIVLPSEWYENNPRTVIEGFALGKPAIGARIGGIPELVKDHETGFTFTSGDATDLRTKIESALKDPVGLKAMAKKARQMAETHLSADVHYDRLIKIYQGILN